MKSKQLRKMAKADKMPYRAWLRVTQHGAGAESLTTGEAVKRVMRAKGMR